MLEGAQVDPRLAKYLMPPKARFNKFHLAKLPSILELFYSNSPSFGDVLGNVESDLCGHTLFCRPKI
ncbi:uncharacterized protein PHALS_13693 [Plasmopara halstedii]|uniref:Uncharacterized protein n=1 Tax=Plasmopara halstedii TaxID=4781 RepID=A0A0P1APY9_PLAHL|nr:uncharacterized protein PHALS_13693 [Plasmopara halstedii]CEG43500.1 hypothetical protein PHALS_13693 [Plasmopara halstedii]|eukprot:XP_024579869.1 hypothetical protein PHALS_13693 [Plasmopara halstedii]